MIYAGYNPKLECLHVQHANKHHCHVPAEVWELTPETVCAVCMLKNHTLFVDAALIESRKKPPAEVMPFRKPRHCGVCGYVQISSVQWDNKVRICAECRFEGHKRLGIKKSERQCGR